MAKSLKRQVIMSTYEDAHGERATKEMLELMSQGPLRRPLSQHHDMSMGTIGYMENLEVIADEKAPGEWLLVADITFTGDIETIPKGGFSIGYTVVEEKTDDTELIILLPYPHYNDAKLRDTLRSRTVALGRHVKKEVEPVTIALVVIPALLAPVWAWAFKEKVVPILRNFISTIWKQLHSHKIGSDLSLLAQDKLGNSAKLILIPDRANEAETLDPKHIERSLEEVHAFFEQDEKAASIGVDHMRLCYYPKLGKYRIVNAVYMDGTDQNFVP